MKEYSLVSHDTGSCRVELPEHKYSRESFHIGQRLTIKTLVADGKTGHKKILLNCIVCAITDYLICVGKLKKVDKKEQIIYKTCFKYVDFDKTGTAEVME